MISSSNRGMFHMERSAVEIGYQIHMAVIDEGRREGCSRIFTRRRTGARGSKSMIGGRGSFRGASPKG